MKKSFNFTNLGIILLGYFAFNIILNFFSRFLPKRQKSIQTVAVNEPVITYEKDNKIGFVTEEIPPEIKEDGKTEEPEN